MCALLHIDETQLATGVCYFSLDLVKLQYFCSSPVSQLIPGWARRATAPISQAH